MATRGVFVIVVASKDAGFIGRALSGAFQCCVVLEGKHLQCAAELVRQNIAVIAKMPEQLAEKVKAELVIFPDGYKGKAKENYLIWQTEGKVDERDKIVEKAIQFLRTRKLVRPL